MVLLDKNCYFEICNQLIALIAKLISILQEVDMIVAGLTITSHREEVVDFTVPFFEETSTVLVRANLTKQDDLWTYLFAPLQVMPIFF